MAIKSSRLHKKNLPVGRFTLNLPISLCYFTATRRGTTPNCPCIIFAFATAIDLLFLAPRNKNSTDSEIFEFGILFSLSDIYLYPYLLLFLSHSLVIGFLKKRFIKNRDFKGKLIH